MMYPPTYPPKPQLVVHIVMMQGLHIYLEDKLDSIIWVTAPAQ